MFPNFLPIDATYMDYAMSINAFVWLFASVTWFAWARKNWKGLNQEIFEAVPADADRDIKD